MRLQIDTTPAMDQLMDELMKLTGVSSKKELFNNALTLFDWAVQEAQKGRSIASINEKDASYRELQMPALTHASRYSNGDGSLDKNGNVPLEPRRVAKVA